MSYPRVNRAALLLMVAVLVVAPMTMAVGAVTTSTTQSNNTYNVADNRTYNVTDSITIWDRSPFSFELATEDATKTIQGGSTVVNLTEGPGEVPLEDTGVSVYPTGEPVTTVFENQTNVPTSNFDGNDTQVVIARLDSDTPATTSLGMVSSSGSNVTELFTAGNANQNATFWVENSTEQIDGGSVQTDVSFSQSGAYALFLATGDSFSAPEDGGNLSVNGESTIVGMTNAVVEDEPAPLTDVSEPVVPGDNATFTVDPGEGTTTNVSVLLYNPSTVEDSRTEFVAGESIDSSLDPNDLTIRHSIANVSGVAEFDGPTPILGTEFNDQEYSGTVSVVGVLERAFEEANARQDDRTDGELTIPDTEVIKKDDAGIAYENTLDASAVSKTNISGSTPINVQTFENQYITKPLS
ncbi:hypothetical protein ACOZ32_14225 (plasmid) [Halobacterium sp. MBLA0001]|uniref:hypothetical protein n=1 Tax=Halobacterium sp. MBLA0001 TaxID=3413511 RepID=UPI003C74DD52